MSMHKLTDGVSLITSIPGKEVFKFFDNEGGSTEGPVFFPVSDISQVLYDADTTTLYFNTHYGNCISIGVEYSDAVAQWGADFGAVLVAGFSTLLENFYSGQNIGEVMFFPACFKPVTE